MLDLTAFAQLPALVGQSPAYVAALHAKSSAEAAWHALADDRFTVAQRMAAYGRFTAAGAAWREVVRAERAAR